MDWLLTLALTLTGTAVVYGDCEPHVKGWQHENWIYLCSKESVVLRHEAIHQVQQNLGRNILPESTLSPLVERLPEGDVLFTVVHYHENDVAAELEARVLQDLPTPVITYLVLTSHFGRSPS